MNKAKVFFKDKMIYFMRGLHKRAIAVTGYHA